MRRLLVAAVCWTTLLSLSTPTAAASFQSLGKKPITASPTLSGKASVDCAAAIDVSLGDVTCGNNADGPDDVTSWGCSPGWNAAGGEIVYRLAIDTPTAIEVRLDADCDLDVYVLSACGEEIECLGSGDIGVRSLDALQEDVYVVVDGYVGAECAFCVEFLAAEPVNELDQADLAEATSLACSIQTLSDTTCDDTNNLDYDDRHGFLGPGPEQWFVVTLNPGGSLEATATMAEGDVVLWGWRTHQGLWATDFHGTAASETLYADNFLPTPWDIYVGVDSYTAACAEFELELKCKNGQVRNLQTSFGRAKARFGGGGR